MKNIRKDQLLSYLKSLDKSFSQTIKCVPSLLDSVQSDWAESMDHVVKAVELGAVFVPVVGGFSTGKSAALNALMDRQILPEDVSPETAIPAELWYSESEYIEALSTSGGWSKHQIDDLKTLSAQAENYQLVKVFINVRFLKEIQPLVLIDMPGFDSGMDQHNQAILRYITTGALYLYMIRAKAGTMSQQDVRRIEEIIGMGKTLKSFLTMTDLASPDELKATQEYVSNHLNMLTGDGSLSQINKDDVINLQNTLKAADISSLFDNLVLSPVRNLYFTANSHINNAINALSSSSADVNERAKDTEQVLQKIEHERDRMLAEVQQNSLVDKTEPVIKKLERALYNALDELAVMASNGEAALSRGVADIVRSTLTVEIQQVVRRITTDIAYQFKGDIAIGKISVSENTNWLNDSISVIENEIMKSLVGLNQSNQSGSQEQGQGIMNALSIAGLAAPHPVLKVVLAILPGIIGMLFEGFRTKNKSEELRQAISSQVIPSVISQVRPQVLESLNEVEGEIIRTISNQFTTKIESQRAINEQVSEASKTELETLQKKLEELKEIRNEMNSSAEKVIAQ